MNCAHWTHCVIFKDEVMKFRGPCRRESRGSHDQVTFYTCLEKKISKIKKSYYLKDPQKV